MRTRYGPQMIAIRYTLVANFEKQEEALKKYLRKELRKMLQTNQQLLRPMAPSESLDAEDVKHNSTDETSRLELIKDALLHILRDAVEKLCLQNTVADACKGLCQEIRNDETSVDYSRRLREAASGVSADIVSRIKKVIQIAEKWRETVKAKTFR